MKITKNKNIIIDWGNFQDPGEVEICQIERRRFGHFYYRFPNGESGADVYDRVTVKKNNQTNK